MAKKESKNENKVKKHFFKDFKAELKKVIWPTPKQLVNNTVAVVTSINNCCDSICVRYSIWFSKCVWNN